jgi:hypothetical protein
VRHRLAMIIGLAVCAVLAGARSFTAIAEWAADARTLARLGVKGVVTSESTGRAVIEGCRHALARLLLPGPEVDIYSRCPGWCPGVRLVLLCPSGRRVPQLGGVS